MLSFAALVLVSLAVSSADAARMPNKALGIYILLAKDEIRGFNTDSVWTPSLYPWQQTNLNVLYFTFINPKNMKIPYSFKKLAATRGTGGVGAVPRDTVILFSIGGAGYSRVVNPWFWLETKEAAEAMAAQVAQWPALYGCDGIDMDIERGAGGLGSTWGEPGPAGYNLEHFLRKLKQLNPSMIVTMAVARRPHIEAQMHVVNQVFKPDGGSQNLIDGGIGVMRYKGAESLTWVHNYDQAADKIANGEAHPIKVNVPRSSINVGCGGITAKADIMTIAKAVTTTNLKGMIVWYSSVENGFSFQKGRGDANAKNESRDAFGEVMRKFDKFNY